MANLKTVFQKRIPTILGLVFLLAGLGVAIFMVGGSTNTFFPKASPETTPKNIKVTNVTEKSFTISFITDIETPGYLLYGSESTKTTIRSSDDREQTAGVPQNSTTHHITVRGLNPSTKYYFLIGTASNFKYSDAGQPYEVTTAPQIGAPPEAVTAYGNVLTSTNKPGTDSIVYLTMPNGGALSALVKTSGSWAIPLAPARTTDLKTYLKPDGTTPVTVFVQGTSIGQTSQVQATVSQTQPLEALTLGVNPQSLTTPNTGAVTDTPTADDAPVEGTPVGSAFSSSDLNPAIESNVTESPEGLTIITIPENGTVLNETQPTIEGTAPANTTINVKIQSSPEYNLKAVTDENGNFSITPPADLAEGNHTLTITYKDTSGKTQTVKRTFVVQANPTGSVGSTGTTSTPAYVSSPSGTKATPKATATAKPATRSAVTQTATDSGVPVSGSTEQTILMLTAGAFLAMSGFFLSRKLEEETALENISEE